MAARLTDAVMTLPWAYELMVLLPLEVSGATEIQLDERFALRAIVEAAATQYPVHPVDTLAQHMYHQRFPEGIASSHYYFVGRFSGYLHDVSPVPELEELLDAAKGVLGLALAAPVMKIESISRGTSPPAPPIIVYRVTAGVRELLPYRWLSADDTALLARLTMARASKSLPTVLAAIQVAFKHTTTRGAARWYLDSFGGTNGVLQTVQATVALEMLLGDRKQAEQVGVTKLLANRLAFLIGTSPKQRDAIIADFGEKYDVRSDIVHNGKAVLGEAESAALYALRDYARQAIVKQLEQIWIEAGKPGTPPTSG